MTRWTLEQAKNRLSDVVRRALANEPQLVGAQAHLIVDMHVDTGGVSGASRAQERT
jgi:hypothetical protein